VERLKEQRRAARLEKEAKAAKEAGQEVSLSKSEPELEYQPGDPISVFGLESDAGKTMNGMRGRVVRYLQDKGRYEVQLDQQSGQTVNVKPAHLQKVDVTPAEIHNEGEQTEEKPQVDAEARLAALEGEVTSLLKDISLTQAEVERIDLDDVEAEEAVEEVSQRAKPLTASLGRIQSEIDDISIVGLNETQRDVARSRRKALNGVVESQLMPAISSLGAALNKARRAVS